MFELKHWIVFFIVIGLSLAFDLGVLNKRPRALSFKESLYFSMLWWALATLFGLWIYYISGTQKALEYFTGYIVELSLSMDNVFVFILIFTYFKIPTQYQHRLLYWGI
jgi:tellurite resistance protein TerC